MLDTVRQTPTIPAIQNASTPQQLKKQCAFKVCIRIRPSDDEDETRIKRINYKQQPNGDCVCYVDCPQLTIGNEVEQRQFIFDSVFGETSCSKEIFDSQVKSMVEDSIFQGYNATIFAYGQTGAGKSYTMFGSFQDQNNEPGIIEQTIETLFATNNLARVTLSFLEIYNEQLRDLIADNGHLTISEDQTRGVVVSDAVEIEVYSIEQARQIIFTANQKRVMAATQANVVSSRSHAIIQFVVQTTGSFVSKVSLVDLAGSERASVTENRGLRLQEGANINKSLLSLGNCINVLADAGGQKKGMFVPYRDSKLTRLLKDALGGNSRTVMIGCVSPAICCHEETVNTLKYAVRARAIKKQVSQNYKQLTYSNSNEVNQLQKQVSMMKDEISQLHQLLANQQSENTKFQLNNNTNVQELLEKMESIIEEKFELRQNLKEIDELQKQNREGLKQQLMYLRKIEECIELEQKQIQSGFEQYRLKQRNEEFENAKSEIREFEGSIEENERIRSSIEKRIEEIQQERNQIALTLMQICTRSTSSNSKDAKILELQREIEILKDQMKARDVAMEQKSKPQLTRTISPVSQENKFQFDAYEGKGNTPLPLQEIKNIHQEVSFDLCESGILMADVADERNPLEPQVIQKEVSKEYVNQQLNSIQKRIQCS